jgi:hypothetical protein
MSCRILPRPSTRWNPLSPTFHTVSKNYATLPQAWGLNGLGFAKGITGSDPRTTPQDEQAKEALAPWRIVGPLD